MPAFSTGAWRQSSFGSGTGSILVAWRARAVLLAPDTLRPIDAARTMSVRAAVIRRARAVLLSVHALRRCGGVLRQRRIVVIWCAGAALLRSNALRCTRRIRELRD